jgi:hypothetical protein
VHGENRKPLNGCLIGEYYEQIMTGMIIGSIKKRQLKYQPTRIPQGLLKRIAGFSNSKSLFKKTLNIF